jgi:hypothetical protein
MKDFDRMRRTGRVTRAASVVIAASALAGCGGQYADVGTIDIEASRKAAAEKGSGPRLKTPPPGVHPNDPILDP